MDKTFRNLLRFPQPIASHVSGIVQFVIYQLLFMVLPDLTHSGMQWKYWIGFLLNNDWNTSKNFVT